MEKQGQKELHPSFFPHERRELKVVGPTYLISLSPLFLSCTTKHDGFGLFSPISLVGISLFPKSLLSNTVGKVLSSQILNYYDNFRQITIKYD